MVVLAISTVAVILIVVGVVAIVGVIFVALGPMSSREQLRDNVGAEMGAMGASALKGEPENELRPDDSWSGPDAEANLDRRFE
jgi:hypothetical protein